MKICKDLFLGQGALITCGVLTALLIMARALFVAYGPLDLSPDEAQYWTWGEHLQLSYYSKPPLVPWLMAAFTGVLGNTEVAVRIGGIFFHAVMSVAVFMWFRAAVGMSAAWFGFAALQLVPILGAGALVFTTDSALVALWVLALWVVYKIDFRAAAPQWRLWIALGILVGVAGLAKYSAAFFYPLLGIYLFAHVQRRPWLLKPHPYVAGVISLVLQLPVLVWNAQNGWVGFLHVAGQSGGDNRYAGLEGVLNLFMGQALVIGPLVFLGVLIFWLLGRKSGKLAELLFWFSFPLFVVFVGQALVAKVQANWPLLAMLTGVLGLVVWAAQAKRLRVVLAAALMVGAPITLLLHDTWLLKTVGYTLPPKADPTFDMQGWQGLGQALAAYRAQLGPDSPILSTRYQTGAALAFYTPGQPQLLYLNPGYRRMNQYDLWSWPQDLKDKTVFYVNEQNTLEPIVLQTFNKCAPLSGIASARGDISLRIASLWLCWDYKGLPAKPAIRQY